MFHTYVLASNRRTVDFDRARSLMDTAILRAAVRAMNKDMRHDATIGVQWVWDYYCSRHSEKYGTPFRPDVDPTWDS